MTITEPESMEELVYFTRRTTGKGKVMAWAHRKKCPKCGKAEMGKPIDDKTGQPKIRAKEYVCPECGHTEEKQEYEESLTLEIKYTCPYCGNEGETTTEYKKKSFDGVPSYVFTCQKCGKKVPITKKMKGVGDVGAGDE